MKLAKCLVFFRWGTDPANKHMAALPAMEQTLHNLVDTKNKELLNGIVQWLRNGTGKQAVFWREKGIGNFTEAVIQRMWRMRA